MPKPPLLFISYSSSKKDWVHQFVDQLTKAGLRVWIDEREIALGDSLTDKLAEGMQASDYLILVVSPDSLPSTWFNFELGASLGSGKKVIPIVDKDICLVDLPGPLKIRKFLVMGTPQETAREVADGLVASGQSI